jgi:hypothetical protein
VFIGYSELHKGYKCLHIPTGCVYISRDVIFDEHVFSFSKLPAHSSCTTAIDASALLPSPGFLTSHYDNAAVPILVSTNLFAGVPGEVADDEMLVASGEQQQNDDHQPEHEAEAVLAPEIPISEPVSATKNQGVRTRLPNNIRKLKQRTDGTMAYLASLGFSEPIDYKSTK